jgi:uncharacterized SAM-binding protein YcdF (DUF218 family)
MTSGPARTPRRRGGVLLILTVIGLCILPAMWFAGSALVIASPVDDPDAIVSLASHEWERLPVAAAVARRYPAATIVLTLPQPVSDVNCHDCGRRVDRLARDGVDRARVRVVPLTARGTYGEAQAIRAYAVEHTLRRLLIVTSPYHTRRSLATFETVFSGTGVRLGIEPATAGSPARPDRWWTAGYDRAYVAYEWAARLYYWLKHRVPLTE